MRLYTFSNMYLSSVQVGIQSLHVVADMFIKYKPSEQRNNLYEWAENHKTVICLNGGNSADLREIIRKLAYDFSSLHSQLPFSFFNEDYDSLDGALTCVGVIVPEKIYNAAEYLRKYDDTQLITVPEHINPDVSHDLTDVEIEFANFLNNFGLAK